jgi:hypothetical protein
MEHTRYQEVWTLSEQSAREFFGAPRTAVVVVLKERPELPREIERYRPDAKLFGVRIPVNGCRCAGCTGKQKLMLVPQEAK